MQITEVKLDNCNFSATAADVSVVFPYHKIASSWQLNLALFSYKFFHSKLHLFYLPKRLKPICGPK